MAKTRLGFDLGSSSMKVALLRDNSLVRLEKVRLPENLVDERGTIALPHMFTQFLKQTKKELSLPRVPAALVLPPSQVICRLVTMPNMTAEQLMMNLPYEFSDFIQGVADQYFCDYALCRPAEGEERENGVPMMAAVAAKNTLAGYYKMFSQAGIRLKNYHCASSAAVLNYPWTHMNMVRPGIALYGHYPDPASEIRGEPRLMPVMTLKARVTSVRTMPVGAKLGYGCTATLPRESRIAVLSIGYADGLPRSLSNKLQVKLHGTPCPILGRICMDMCMADVTALPQVRVGDVAVIYDKDLNRVAELAGTITDELVCRVSGRVPRVYWENGARIV